MPKIIDYAGRFAFFELASFTIVRDLGVADLSRHAVARRLATSISTIRRLLNPEADLRRLALNEVAYRRRLRLTPLTGATGVDGGMRLLLPWIPSHAGQVAEELVWWRPGAPPLRDRKPRICPVRRAQRDDRGSATTGVRRR